VRTAAIAVSVLVVAYGLVWSFAPDVLPWSGSREPFSYDASKPLNGRRSGERREGTRIAWNVRYAADDGTVVPAIFTVPRNNDGPLRCVIVQQGLGSDKRLMRRGGLLRTYNVATFTIDARFQGDRGSRERAAEAARRPARLAAMLEGTVVDLRRGIDWLEEQPECRLDGVGYVGLSLGGIIGAILAGADERIVAPVLVMAGGDWRAIAAGGSVLLDQLDTDPEAAADGMRRLDDFDPTRWVGRIAPRPVLMFNGKEDTIIPPTAGLALHEAAREPKLAVWLDTGHNPLEHGSNVLATQLGRWFLEYVVPFQRDATPGPATGPRRARAQRGPRTTTARTGTPRPS
jgi:uncharacterized protein